ncbi:MAG: response regulator [Sedimentisphaerales bacterium]|jgi:CheY-like chemotaxis protein
MENEQKQITVLLVEDEAGDQKLIKTALLGQNDELKLKIVSSGEAAMDYLQMSLVDFHYYPKPNLILLDLNMLGMGGKEFLKQIKADDNLCSIPVVVVTTSDIESDIEDCYAMHAAGYVQKSASVQELNDVIQKVAHYWFSTSAMLKN